MLGRIRCQRAYYYCRRCGQGQFPFDALAGFNEHNLSAGAERVVSLLGVVCDSFAEAATKLLPEAVGLRLGESTVQHTTEDAGQRLGALLAQKATLGPDTPFDWHKDAKGRSCAYVSVDCTGVPQQAKGGGAAEGRMPAVGMIYNSPPPKKAPEAPVKRPSGLETPGYQPVQETAGAADALPGRPQGRRPPAMQARYLAGLYTLEQLGEHLRRQAAQVGMERADLWIALSDAGSGLEDFLRKNFNRPDLVVILDFFHPAGYLERLALAWHPKDADAKEALTQQWCHLLKHQGGAALLAQLRQLEVPRRAGVKEAYTEALRYLENHQGRMNYPYYLSQGWEIGSGPVESACKTVVGQRLKLAGMRWREYGTDGVCHLRALFKSDKGQWRAFWERLVNKPPISSQPK